MYKLLNPTKNKDSKKGENTPAKTPLTPAATPLPKKGNVARQMNINHRPKPTSEESVRGKKPRAGNIRKTGKRNTRKSEGN